MSTVLETRGMITLDFANIYSRYRQLIIIIVAFRFSLIVHGLKGRIRKMCLKRNREIKILYCSRTLVTFRYTFTLVELVKFKSNLNTFPSDILLIALISTIIIRSRFIL